MKTTVKRPWGYFLWKRQPLKNSHGKPYQHRGGSLILPELKDSKKSVN